VAFSHRAYAECCGSAHGITSGYEPFLFCVDRDRRRAARAAMPRSDAYRADVFAIVTVTLLFVVQTSLSTCVA